MVRMSEELSAFTLLILRKVVNKMKSKKRRYMWVGLLLASALGMQGVTDIWAETENDAAGEEVMIREEKLEEQLTERADEAAGISENAIDGELTGLSENETDGKSIGSLHNGDMKHSYSDNILSANKEKLDSQAWEEDIYEPINVVLPTEIPFSIVLFGEEGLEGWIKSEQFCIENRGYEDVRISIHGVCSGEKEENYVICGSSVENGYIQGKKNVWAYLRWEDENGEILDQSEIVMGDASNPGEGELILKAPERDENGEIINTDCDSKAYFTFRGDIKSDMDELWRSDELKFDLNLYIESISSVDIEERGVVEQADGMEIPVQPEVSDTAAEEELKQDDDKNFSMQNTLSENIYADHEAGDGVSDNEGEGFQISQNSIELHRSD